MKRSVLIALACATTLVGGVFAFAQNSTSTSNSQTSNGNATASSSSRAQASSGAQQGGSFGGGHMGFGTGSGSDGSSMSTVRGPVWVINWERSKDAASMTSSQDIEAKHEKWVKEVFYARGIMMEGYFESGGRMALVSGSEQVAQSVANDSPLIQSGLATATVKKWNVTHSFMQVAGQTASAPRAAGSGGNN
ncbi:MAG: hypothetical protein KF824_08735 [Fimbriimonadaceae bacterium]|nr:MAG: hypothetical protein KF824_08735 [Fimbriimonadaceae bacterium]